jgi:predicted anti-sigma-YlaC factor YlaD
VECATARELLSAQLDGETSDDESRVADAHLGSCAACRQWWHEIGHVTRLLRVRPAEPVPDVSGAVLARVGVPSPGRGEWVRFALAVLAATELVVALPGLILGEGAGSIHDARHVGSFGVAIAIGLLYVAWRPARALGILPIAAALAATMLITSGLDVVDGRTSLSGELHHLLELVGLVLVWLLAGRPVPGRRVRSRRRSALDAAPVARAS